MPTKLRDGEEEYDIRVRLAPEFRNDFAAIARTPLYSPRGAAVRTGDIVRMEPGVGPTNIEREQRRRQAKIGIELDDRPLGDVTTDLDGGDGRRCTLPPNFEWGFAGDVEMMQESAAAMGLALLLAVAFIYIVLASQFESFTEPFLIMLSLPLAVVGALLAHAADRQQHRHAGDDRRGDADGPGHQERDPAGRPDQPLPPRGGPVDQGRASSRPGRSGCGRS